MQNLSRNKKIAIILIATIFIGIIIASIFIVKENSRTNQFGKFVKVQNYDKKIKNVPSEVKDVVESYLYNLVKKNSAEDFDPTKIPDAYIRESSDSQNYNREQNVYTGTFIIDIESVKQSYKAQYSYSDTNLIDTGGDPIVLSCLPADQLKYGEFNCKDLVSEQGGLDERILQYLPYSNFSFKITPSIVGEEETLTLLVKLTIPESDLLGDAASRANTVSSYKQEVAAWINSKGINPKDYIIRYNYRDSGEYLNDSYSAN